MFAHAFLCMSCVKHVLDVCLSGVYNYMFFNSIFNSVQFLSNKLNISYNNNSDNIHISYVNERGRTEDSAYERVSPNIDFAKL